MKSNQKQNPQNLNESANLNNLMEIRGGNSQSQTKPPKSASDTLAQYINNLPKKKK